MSRLPLLAALALGLASPALAYTASNGLKIIPRDADTFEVAFDGGAGESAYWCAAADYVAYGQGLPGKTRLFRATPVPRKQGQGVGFTLDPAEATRNNGLSLFGSRDGTISVAHALSAHCRLFVPFGRD